MPAKAVGASAPYKNAPPCKGLAVARVGRDFRDGNEAMSRLALVIVADVIAFVLVAAGLASRIPDFTLVGSVLGFLAFAVSLRWLWSPD